MRLAKAGALLSIGFAIAFPASGQELRIGFVNTTTGGAAVIGKLLEEGFRFGLESKGWQKDDDKFDGVSTKVFFADDQTKSDVGIREVEKLLKEHQVHVVAGIIWGNVLTAVAPAIFENKRLLIGAISGLAPFAGKQCNPLFVSASFQNAQTAEAMGELLTRRKITTVVTMAPNYQAGNEYLDAFERSYKDGKIADRIMFKLGQTDFQAEFSKVRARKPDAVVAFAPGAMGIAFVRQWQASGLRDVVKLHSIYLIDGSNIDAIGEAAAGIVDTNNWNPDVDNPINRQFIKDYTAKYSRVPSLYAVYGYDTATLIATGMKRVNGKYDDALGMARAIRTNTLTSPRGVLRFNVNGFLIQPYYASEIILGADKRPIYSTREVVFNRPDSYWQECPEDKRVN